MSVRRSDLGFNFSSASIRSPSLKFFEQVWGAVMREPLQPVLLHRPQNWSLVLDVDDLSRKVKYESIAEEVRKSGFDFTGRLLEEIDLGSADFFQTIIESVIKNREPAFCWANFTSFTGRTGDFEAGAFPIHREYGQTKILVVESWRGVITEEVPEFFQGKLRRR